MPTVPLAAEVTHSNDTRTTPTVHATGDFADTPRERHAADTTSSYGRWMRVSVGRLLGVAAAIAAAVAPLRAAADVTVIETRRSAGSGCAYNFTSWPYAFGGSDTESSNAATGPFGRTYHVADIEYVTGCTATTTLTSSVEPGAVTFEATGSASAPNTWGSPVSFHGTNAVGFSHTFEVTRPAVAIVTAGAPAPRQQTWMGFGRVGETQPIVASSGEPVDEVVELTPGKYVFSGNAQQDTYNFLAPDSELLRSTFGASFSLDIEEDAPACTVTRLQGSARAIRYGAVEVALAVGAVLDGSDTLHVDPGGALGFECRDGMSWSVVGGTEGSSLVIDEYRYGGAATPDASLFRMLQGLFVYTSGLLGKGETTNNMDTPLFGIGIRGTEFVTSVEPSRSLQTIHLISGRLELVPHATGQLTVVEAPITVRIEYGSLSTAALDPVSYAQIKQQALAAFAATPPGALPVPALPGAACFGLLAGLLVLAARIARRTESP